MESSASAPDMHPVEGCPFNPSFVLHCCDKLLAPAVIKPPPFKLQMLSGGEELKMDCTDLEYDSHVD